MNKKRIFIIVSVLILVFAAILGTVAFATSEEDPAVKIKSFALNLGDAVHIKVTAEATAIPEEIPLQLLVWSEPQTEYTVENDPEVFNAYGIDKETGRTIFYYTNVSAKEMADDFYFVVCANYNGEYVYSPVKKYSVLQYAYPKTKEGSTSELKPLLKAMLEYGAEAQLHFAYNTQRLANDTYYQLTVKGGALPDGLEKGLFLATDTVVLTPVTPENMKFANWKDADGLVVSTNENLTISNMDKDASYSAFFVDANHNHEYEFTLIPPTCTEAGYNLYKCEGCGDYYTTDPTEPTGHTLGEWYLSKNVTADSNGEMRLDCLNCGYHETKEIEVITSGNFGNAGKADASTPAADTATYTIFADGTLRVQGTGSLYNCNWNGELQPFKSYRANITRLIVCEGITSTSGGNFAKLHNLTSFELPKSLTALNNNAFWASFSSDMTKITIPATVTNLGTYLFGVPHIKVDYPSAKFLDIIIENPNTEFTTGTNWHCMFNSGTCNGDITLYSYGETNNVKAFAEKIGAKYIDLNKVVEGVENNLAYTCFDGELTLKPADITLPATLPESMPWLLKIDRSEIKNIIIGNGITEIPAGYFSNYTALENITIPNSVLSIGDMAFATDAENSTKLSLNFPENITTIGNNVFKNRTDVAIEAFKNSAADNFEEDGVSVHLRSAFKLLMIGNSLSLDAADCTSVGTPSMLYDILKAMLGDDSYVEIGVLYSGARTAAWHATVAEEEASAYSFYYINDDTNGIWKSESSATTKQGLLHTNWSYVTIQPYGNETRTGLDNSTTGASGTVTKNEKFYPLSASLPYLIDVIHENAPFAKIYYYLTWGSTTDTSALNLQADNYEVMIKNAIKSSAYVGTESNVAFSGVIPGGTAIQNARTTYLAFLKCEDEADPHCGLQRDNVHLSKHVGRYAVALTFANILVPEADRVEGYVLPGASDSPVIGKLPAEYTLLAKMSADLAAESVTKSGDEQYRPVGIEGYTVDPSQKLATAIEAADFSAISASSAQDLKTKLETAIAALEDNETVVSVTVDSFTADAYTATVTITFGYTTKTVTING